MKQLINPLIEKTVDVLKFTTSAIIPFCERPSEDRQNTESESGKNMNAADLFSFFTADIIKEQILFTR